MAVRLTNASTVIVVFVLLTFASGIGQAAVTTPPEACDTEVPAPGNRLELGRYVLTGTPSPWGWANLAGFAAGDVDGDGQVELTFIRPAGFASSAAGGPDSLRVAAPEEGLPATYRAETFRLVGAWKGQSFQLFLGRLAQSRTFALEKNGPVSCDVFPGGGVEVLLPHHQAGVFSVHGRSLIAADAWKDWPETPSSLGQVAPLRAGGAGDGKALAALTPSSGGPAALHLFRGSPKGPARDRARPLSLLLDPRDRFAAGDLDGDGRDELVVAHSTYGSRGAQGITILDLESGRTRATLGQRRADDLALGDVDQDGRMELILAENQLDETGWPSRATVRALRWGPGSLREIRTLAYSRAWVADLAVADAANYRKPELVIALLERASNSQDVILRLILPLSSGT